MFAVGDMVVYPLHGAGRIVTIENREFDHQLTQYLVLDMLTNRLRVCLPLKNAERLGLRPVSSVDMLSEVQRLLRSGKPYDFRSVPWNRRSPLYIEKLRTGDILDVALVVRSLTLQEREKRLSSGEKQMLNNARNILGSELQVLCQCDARQAEAWMDEQLN